jgi:hypothetical protein
MFQEKVSGLALLGVRERKAVAFSGNHYEMGFYSHGMEFVIEFFALSNGNQCVFVPVEDKEWRRVSADVIDRAALDGFRALFID